MSTELAVIRMAPKAARFAKPIEDSCIRWGIKQAIHKAHYMAHIAHESCGFTVLEENLNYSAKGLLTTFGKYFNPTTAAQYARKPVAIGNHVYANRMGNGSEASGDGYRHRGQGLIQTTGKINQLAFSVAEFGDDRVVRAPDMLQQPETAANAAGYFWHTNNLNTLVDEDDILDLLALNDDIRSVTKRINGGYNGLEDRMRWLKLAKEALWVSHSV